MREKCNVPNTRSTLNKTLTFAHKSILSDCKRNTHRRGVRFHRFVLFVSFVTLFPRSVSLSLPLPLLVFIPVESSFHNNHHFSAVCPFYCALSVWNNERVWKCLIKSNKSPCDLFLLFFSPWKMFGTRGESSRFYYYYSPCSMSVPNTHTLGPAKVSLAKL